jgi:hypothetical protein
MEGPKVEEVLTALEEQKPQADWPTWEQEAAISQCIMMVLYDLTLHGHIDPVRMRNSGETPRTIANGLAAKLINTLK